jgi:hypothetical protein
LLRYHHRHLRRALTQDSKTQHALRCEPATNQPCMAVEQKRNYSPIYQLVGGLISRSRLGHARGHRGQRQGTHGPRAPGQASCSGCSHYVSLSPSTHSCKPSQGRVISTPARARHVSPVSLISSLGCGYTLQCSFALTRPAVTYGMILCSSTLQQFSW